ncbi:hypothetical protein L195_g048535, partial [Trifolium pratense]
LKTRLISPEEPSRFDTSDQLRRLWQDFSFKPFQTHLTQPFLIRANSNGEMRSTLNHSQYLVELSHKKYRSA